MADYFGLGLIVIAFIAVNLICIPREGKWYQKLAAVFLIFTLPAFPISLEVLRDTEGFNEDKFNEPCNISGTVPIEEYRKLRSFQDKFDKIVNHNGLLISTEETTAFQNYLNSDEYHQWKAKYNNDTAEALIEQSKLRRKCAKINIYLLGKHPSQKHLYYFIGSYILAALFLALSIAIFVYSRSNFVEYRHVYILDAAILAIYFLVCGSFFVYDFRRYKELET